MIPLPHDTTDVLLAPVILALDQEIDRLAGLSQDELYYMVALSTDREPTRARRRELLLEAISRDVETHHWELGWDPRGIRLTHETHKVVLGVPESVRTFVGS